MPSAWQGGRGKEEDKYRPEIARAAAAGEETSAALVGPDDGDGRQVELTDGVGSGHAVE